MTEVEMLRAANEGHVRMIADLAAERDKIKRELEKAQAALGLSKEAEEEE